MLKFSPPDEISTHRIQQVLPSIGVLVTNLGTPSAPTKSSVRKYLKEFLSDPRVVEANRLVWWCVLNGIILNIRPARSAKAYKGIWTEDGSPLLVHSKRQALLLQESIIRNGLENVHVELAMRYGHPSIKMGLDALRAKGCGKILILPLYPQYAAATTATTFDAVSDILKKWRWVPETRTVSSYHDHGLYIQALSNSIREHWEEHGKPDCLLMSFHGIPKRYHVQGDPYPCFCHKTARLVAENLGLTTDQWTIGFQSRFGREEWVKPYTDEILNYLGKKGVKRVDVICPGFSADCLETIEEIAIENRAAFLNSGGEEFYYIPALNEREDHISALTQIVIRNVADWGLD
jgi:protoporphyrin/coproporphyrin ferrochelatase